MKNLYYDTNKWRWSNIVFGTSQHEEWNNNYMLLLVHLFWKLNAHVIYTFSGGFKVDEYADDS